MSLRKEFEEPLPSAFATLSVVEEAAGEAKASSYRITAGTSTNHRLRYSVPYNFLQAS
jgi:hypothetical protein